MRPLLEFERHILTQAMRENGTDWDIGQLRVLRECHHGTLRSPRTYVNRGFDIDFVKQMPEEVKFFLVSIKEEILGDYVVCVVDPGTGQPVRMEAVSGPGIPECEFAEQAKRVNSILVWAKQPTMKQLQHRRFVVSNDDIAFFATSAPDHEIWQLTRLDPICVVESDEARIWRRVGVNEHVLIDGVVSAAEEKGTGAEG